MQGIVSRRYVAYNKDIEACVSALDELLLEWKALVQISFEKPIAVRYVQLEVAVHGAVQIYHGERFLFDQLFDDV